MWLELSDLSDRPLDLDVDSWLDDVERQRAARFVFTRDRERFILRRVLLRKRLAELTGVAASDLNYMIGPHGRPRLATGTGHAEVHFSLSSSGPFVLMAFARDVRLGVDIEEVRAYPELSRLATQLLSEAQRTQLATLDASQRPDRFFKFWTELEAGLKLTGVGLTGHGPAGRAPQPSVETRYLANWLFGSATGQRYRAALAADRLVSRVEWTLPENVSAIAGRLT